VKTIPADRERCDNCAHKRELRLVPGTMMLGLMCLLDGMDTKPDDWCEAWADERKRGDRNG
jgi:hypothetical protein